MSEGLHHQLRELRARCRATTSGIDDDECRRQYHDELSPLSWHLGHVFFMEAFWLSETVFGNDRFTAAWRNHYLPEQSPKSIRGQLLPSLNELQDWCEELSQHNDSLWAQVLSGHRVHRLLDHDYLIRFLIQHYAQHYETLQMVRQQRQLAITGEAPEAPELEPSLYNNNFAEVPETRVHIGADATLAPYDNEMEKHAIDLKAFRIARRPVSNSDWLRFMHADGYCETELWDVHGWQWRSANEITQPQHWRRASDGRLYAVETDGPQALAANDPVSGLNWHEASAYARWAGARLPHEYEWEAAARLGLLEQTGHSWEWCANPLHPYPGFRAFPYDGYSLPWFDGKHFVLRGSSRHTQAEIRRPSFRNFYLSTHRHIFAGLRLAL